MLRFRTTLTILQVIVIDEPPEDKTPEKEKEGPPKDREQGEIKPTQRPKTKDDEVPTKETPKKQKETPMKDASSSSTTPSSTRRAEKTTSKPKKLAAGTPSSTRKESKMTTPEDAGGEDGTFLFPFLNFNVYCVSIVYPP